MHASSLPSVVLPKHPADRCSGQDRRRGDGVEDAEPQALSAGGERVGVADKIWEKAIDLAVSFVESEYSLIQGVEREHEKLKRLEERIEATLVDADRLDIEDERALIWLRDLRDVKLDAGDVDEDLQVRPLAARALTRRRLWHHIAPVSLPLLRFRRSVAMAIAEINERYEEISRDRENLALRRGEGGMRVRRMQPPGGSVLPEEALIIGRDGDRDEIVSLLVTRRDGGQLPVVPIYGMGGLGKTALAKLVFNDARVKNRFQSKRIWISAADGFDVVGMTKKIFEFVTGEPCHFSNFDLIQRKVRQRLTGGAGPRNWDDLRLCLPAGGGESRVLITTRKEDVAIGMGTVARESLPGLTDKHCYRLLERRAFPAEGFDRVTGLGEIGEQIARKCQGSPLAAISIGGLLHGEKEKEEWERVLREMEAFPLEENDILPQLNLTYALLPLPLKKCFAFCGIFPEGYLIDKDLLVKLWMAQGFIQPRGTQRMEKLGSQYFEQLLWISFFQASSDRNQGQASPTTYVIPSLFQKLASSLRDSDCVRMVNGTSPEPGSRLENTRHASFFIKSEDEEQAGAPDFTVLHECRKLRTLSLLRFLRALDLNDSAVRELPDSVGELKLLRFLGLRKTKIELLPESVATLSNLQTLELSHCYELRMLPKRTSELTNLRHLGLHVDQPTRSKLQSTPPGIGRLRSLETLSRFIVGTEDGCGLSQMKDLKLRGELWISKLENVRRPEDARQANLRNKDYLHSLTLEWSDSELHNQQYPHDTDMIEGFQPPSVLKYLCILNYNGATVAQVPALEKLTLCDLPDLLNWSVGEGDMARLSELNVSSCPKLGDLHRLPPSVRKLTLKGCKALRRLPQLPDGLEHIELQDVPLVMCLPQAVPSSLAYLAVIRCPFLEWRCRENKGKDWHKIERVVERKIIGA
ncbi:unnamed protein product [Spirodela intermedia]|uniref:Uncharacterized protein n=1 Tax=Spirodela intermedia TaxID=51605 RepID=A0A7I8IY55_SPIIN|nr:unnamed protein product [Spirodela intermedia]CAA6662093.1 unnamed protein product [Spirodela intermedia]